MNKPIVPTLSIKDILNIFGDEENIIVIIRTYERECTYKKTKDFDNIPYAQIIPKGKIQISMHYVNIGEDKFLKCIIEM